MLTYVDIFLIIWVATKSGLNLPLFQTSTQANSRLPRVLFWLLELRGIVPPQLFRFNGDTANSD